MVTTMKEVAKISRAEYERLRGEAKGEERAGPVSDLMSGRAEWGADYWMFVTGPDDHTDMVPVEVIG